MKRLNRTIAVAMLTVACAVPCATAAPVWAEEEAWGTEAQEAEVDVVEDESDGTDDDTPAPGAEYDAATGKYANSFRFKDGAPVANGGDEDGISLMSSRADSLITWSYKDGAYRFSNGIVDSRATAIGIDVSEWQDDINWSKVKSAGVDYAILRCGWGADYRKQDDATFIDNVRGCQKYGIPFGVYLYSYAENTTHAKSEAQHVLRMLEEAGLDPDDLAFPVYYDLEQESDPDIPYILPSNSTLLNIARLFCTTIEGEGFEAGIYANLNWWNTYLTDPAYDQWDRWVAQYNTECDYEGDYSMWQCMSNGKVSGISGPVDMNLSYGDGKLVVDETGVRLLLGNGTYATDEWRWVEGERYYFGEDGYALTGIQQVDGYWYYFSDGGSTRTNCWYTWDDGTRSFFSANYHDGAAIKGGWWTISGSRRYFDGDSRMKAGCVDYVGDYLYWFGEDGVLQTNRWYTWDDGSRSFFSGNFQKGAAISGRWWTISGSRRYFDGDARLVCGEVAQIGDYLYWLDGDGSTRTNCWYAWDDGTRSFFSANYHDGAAVKNWWTVSGTRRYFDPQTSKTLSAGIHEVDGIEYEFDSFGRVV